MFHQYNGCNFIMLCMQLLMLKLLVVVLLLKR